MSKIFSNNSEIIKEELNKIKDSFLYASPKQFDENFDILEAFYETYGNLFGIEDEESYKLLKRNKKSIYERDFLAFNNYKKLVNNFIDNKDFHISYSERIINKYSKNFKHFVYRDLRLREKDMIDIMCDFLDEEYNNSDEFMKLINEERIFSTDLSREDSDELYTGGYTIYNFITNNSLIVLSDNKEIRNLKLMAILMHEFGHVMDNIERGNNRSRKNRVNYPLTSSYVEVYSLLNERLFYDYLTRNKICEENAFCHISLFYSAILCNFMSLYNMSVLQSSLLDDVDTKYAEYNLKFARDDMFVDGPVEMLRRAMIYGYGGLIANYLYNVKRENKDRFDRMFIDFSNNRFDLFNIDIFNKMGTNSDEVLGYLNRDLKKLSEPKKLILK